MIFHADDEMKWIAVAPPSVHARIPTMLDETTYHEDVNDLIDALRPLASQARVESAYWISTPDGEYLSHNGNEWCRDCGTAKVRHLRKHDRKRARDYILDGGWVCEHDTPPACAHCGVRLRANLTVHGGLYELDHFRENQPDSENIDDAYQISEMLAAFQYTKSRYDTFAAEAIEIGSRLVAAVGRNLGSAQE